MGIFRSFFSPLKTILYFFEMIKFEHTIFALPFAYVGMFSAAKGFPDPYRFFFITLAFVSGRTYAMTMNRVIDLPFDKENPRTKERPLVTGRVGKKTVFLSLSLSLFLLLFSAYKLSPLAFKLSPIALFFLSFYHLTKRFSYLSHFFLGFTDGLAPLGAWVAIKDSLFSFSDIPAWLLALVVTFFIAGFDILYQIQDVEFDRRMKLHSIPVKFGIERSLRFARICHIFMVFCLFLFGFFLSFHPFFLLSFFLAIFLLIKEHSLLSPDDLSKLPIVFFRMNSFISVVLFLGIILTFL